MRFASALPLAVIGLAAAHALYLALSAFGTCTVPASDPGTDGDETCVGQVSGPAMLLVGLMALAGVGLAIARPAVAWTCALVALAVALLFGLSVGGVLLPHVGAVLLATATWHLLRLRRAPGPSIPESPSPPPEAP